MIELSKKEQSELSQQKITLNRIRIYVKMRNIKVPTHIQKFKKGVTIKFNFANTVILFQVTNPNKLYEKSTQYIEEMNDEYNIHPLKQYHLFTT